VTNWVVTVNIFDDVTDCTAQNESQRVTAAKDVLRLVVAEGDCFCIFHSFGGAFVQFAQFTDVIGRSSGVMTIFEASSDFYGGQRHKPYFSPQKIDALHKFGFSDNPVGNYFQYVDIETEYDIHRCARLALQVLRVVYEANDNWSSMTIECRPR